MQGEEEFSEIIARGSSQERVQNFLQAVKWRPCLFHSIDLCCTKTTWETFCHVVHNCAKLKILNMAGIEGETHELPLIQASKIVELNLSKTLIDDRFLEFITKRFPLLGILNVSSCYKLTNFGIEKVSFPFLGFLEMAHCMIGIEAILCAIDKHGMYAMCVKGITLGSEDIARLVELHPDITDIRIPTLCGLPHGTVYREALHSFGFTAANYLFRRC